MRKITKSRRGMLMATAASSVALGLSPASAAIAQDEEAGPTEVITVTGIRAAIESSIEAKRESTSIVEAISAEDIGKLPDVSIAESLARLPGLAAQRVRGRAQVVSVRGLGPDFTTALLNGREQVTAGDNRGVEFDQYPSELINQALVYKTPDAQLVSQGLAGTVDLRTIRPLEFGNRSVSLSASYEMNMNDQLNADYDDTGYRLTGTYVNQFADDTVGLVFSIAHQNTPTQGEKYEICNFQDLSGNNGPECFKMFSESRDLDRTAMLGTLEFEPNDTFNASVDVMYTEFTDGGVRRGIELATGNWLGDSNSGISHQTIEASNGLVTAGTFSNVFGVVRNDVQERDAELFSLGFNAQWRPFDNWEFEADVSHSRVERTALDFESYMGFAEGGWPNYPSAIDDVNYNFNGNRYRFNSSVGAGYADPSLMVLTDPGGWGQDGFNKTLNTDDELNALRLSATREFAQGFFTSIEGGLYMTSREKERETIENFVDLASGNGAEAIPSQYLMAPTSLSWVSNIEVPAYDPTALLSDGIYTLRPLNPAFIVGKQWRVEEDVMVAYGQANFESQLGDVPYFGNVGVQVVQTDQSSSGPASYFDPNLNTSIVLDTPVSAGDDYTEVLPSLNVSFELNEDTYLRLGAARTLARARMDDMRASVSVNAPDATVCSVDPVSGTFTYTPPSDTTRSCLSGSSGNPFLRPYIADSFDISLERYFGDGAGYWSIAAFHKEIDSWVFGSVPFTVDASTAVDDIFGAGTAAANPGVGDARFSAAENVNGGWLRGMEFSLSLPAEVFLPEMFEGLGMFATYSITDSEIQPPTANSPITIPGLSETLGNITVYYEREGWEFRVSNRWRSDFLAELPDFTGQPDFRSALEESVVDAQIGYEFAEGPLDGLTVQLQANNVFDERFGTFVNGDERQVRNWEEYGATYTFRLSWRR
ncbi:TonB-dependent receptor [Maricaulis sp. MIT060901]|uniref:TonB-dependent receptor n=1 Tax=Maricaulis sp. MIT060901 TaxID=3096993 RepID=UPI00399C2E7D